MAKFYGKIGYSITEETIPGVWEPKITERKYIGDVLENGRRWEAGDGVNDDMTITNKISIIADPFANQNIGAIRYVEYLGQKWKIRSADIAYPRIILTLGGVYHEQSPGVSEEVEEDSGGYQSVFSTSGGY